MSASLYAKWQRKPGFALIAVAALAIGIGGATAGFAVLYQALLKPSPYPEAGRLLFVHNVFPKGQMSLAGVSVSITAKSSSTPRFSIVAAFTFTTT